jgi:hypothetical protein
VKSTSANSNEAQSNSTSINDVINAAGLVLQALLTHHPESSFVPILSQAIDDLNQSATRLDAVRRLCGVSHVKNLGDVYLEVLPDHEWPKMVSSLGTTAANYLEAHDSGAPMKRASGLDANELEYEMRSAPPTYQFGPPKYELKPLLKFWPKINVVFQSKFARVIGRLAVWLLLMLIVYTLFF